MKSEAEYLKEIIRKQIEKEQTPYILKLQGEIEGLKVIESQTMDKANPASAGDLVTVL